MRRAPAPTKYRLPPLPISNRGKLALLPVLTAASLATALAAPTPVDIMEQGPGPQPKGPGGDEVIRFPGQLPPKVKRAGRAAVKIFYGKSEASGVKVGNDLVFTAGHLVLGQPGQNRTIDCGLSYINNIYDKPGDSSQITNWRAFYDDRYETALDIALLKVRPTDNFNKLPIVRPAPHTPPRGTKVYFVNYQSNLKGPKDKGPRNRYPNASLAANFNSGDYGHAAQFGGVILGRQGYLLEIATSLKGYGPKKGQQKNAHPGASGGPVYDGQGRLIGMEVRGWKPLLASKIKNAHGLKLSKDNKMIQVELVQQVTPGTLKYFKEYIKSSAQC